MTNPLQRYQQDIESQTLIPDPGQARAIESIERLHQDLIAARARMGARTPLLDKWFSRKKDGHVPISGLYLWGTVGRGKTYLVDTFFDSLPFDEKLRIHFHSFMRKIHQGLKQHANRPDPLKLVAAEWSKDITVLCLDEFHVGDITDAMILANLLQALFENGVTLVTTSNESPKDLYKDGLQRQQFLPAIALLEKHLEILELAGDTDYRLRALEQADVYYCPHSELVDDELEIRFIQIAGRATDASEIEIEGRAIPTQAQADGIVWFNFESLCEGPRSANDYIELALCHHTIFLSEIPRLDDLTNDATRRFINLIDELYDRNVNIVISAAERPENLYDGSRLEKPFRRTVSRLLEMQSHEYLARPHLCD